MNKQKGQAQVLVLAGIVILVAVAGGIFFLGRVTAPKPQPQNVATSPQSSPTTQSTPTSTVNVGNWKTYTNKAYSFQLKYPPLFDLEEHSKTNISLVDKSKNLAAIGTSPIYPSILISVEIGVSPEDYIRGQSLSVGEKQVTNKGEFLTAYSEIGGAPILYLLKKDSNIIAIREDLGEFDKGDYHFNQILSTFKFLD